MTTLYFVRHGESSGNIDDTFTGCTDTPLSAAGLKQAELLCGYLCNFKIDSIWSSDLTRARDTVVPLACAKGLDIKLSEDFREINGGEWEKRLYKSLPLSYPEEFSVWMNDMQNAVCPGGESIKHLSDRVYDAALKIALENDGKSVVIATHATPIRTFTARCTGVSPNDIDWVPNASVTKVVFKNGIFSIAESGITDFLGDLVTTLRDI